MIHKLLLVRVGDMRSDLVDQAGVRAFAGSPLNVSPLAWSDEAGLSHYGFELKDLKLKDVESLRKWANGQNGVTLLDHEGDVAATLATVGLRINESAE
jgi:hypothetical protein